MWLMMMMMILMILMVLIMMMMVLVVVVMLPIFTYVQPQDHKKLFHPPRKTANLPPSSKDIFFPEPAIARLRTRPMPVDPVNPTLSTSGCVAIEEPNLPSPVTTLKTPGGRPASAHISANTRAERRVYVAGLRTTVFPIARAGHTFHARSMRGKFHGTIAPTTPCATVVSSSAERRQTKTGEGGYQWSPLAHFSVHELGPSSMVVNVANDGRNVSITRLADGFAVVQRLDAGDYAHVLLEVAGDGVKVTSAGVGRQLGPGAKCLARALNGVIGVVLGALDGFAQNFAG